MKPMQTHGLTEWAPPTSGRFFSYDRRDQAWMEPLGIGRQVPAGLYDVRDEANELVGYCAHNPVVGSYLRLLVTSDIPLLTHRGEILDDSKSLRAIEVRTDDYRIGDERFRFWRCRLVDAPALIESKWLKVIGPDNFSTVFFEIRRKLWDRYHFNGPF